MTDDDKADPNMPVDVALQSANGGPIEPLTPEEVAAIRTIADWIAARCVERGYPPPADVLRALLISAGQVYSFNKALDDEAAAEWWKNQPEH